jgi:hypothetical protein
MLVSRGTNAATSSGQPARQGGRKLALGSPVIALFERVAEAAAGGGC